MREHSATSCGLILKTSRIGP